MKFCLLYITNSMAFKFMLTYNFGNYRLDIGDVKNAIEAFLETKSEIGSLSPQQKEDLEQYIASAPELLYSVSPPPSRASTVRGRPSSFYNSCVSQWPTSRPPSSSIEATSSERGTLYGDSNPGPTAPRIGPASISDTIPDRASSELMFSGYGSSSSSETLRRPNAKGSQLGTDASSYHTRSDTTDPDKLWENLISKLKITSPTPYNSFGELYMAIYPYLWLHGRIWHGDRRIEGTLLISKYSPDSGAIELFRLMAGELGAQRTDSILAFGHDVIPNHRSSSQTIHYSVSHNIPLVPNRPLGSTESLWPPLTIPARERTSRSHQPKGSPKAGRHSKDLFILRKRKRISHEVEIFSALDPKLYTSDPEYPLRGIWTGRHSGTSCDFVLFHQPTQTQVEGIKLTGNDKVCRGERSFVFEDIGDLGTRVILGRAKVCTDKYESAGKFFFFLFSSHLSLHFFSGQLPFPNIIRGQLALKRTRI